MMGWKEIKFKDFIRLQRGYDLFKSQFVEGMFPVVGATNITGYHNEFKVEGPGVVTGRTGTIGTIQYINANFWPHQDALWVKDFKGNLPKYVYYFLKTLKLEVFNAGGAVPALNRNHLDNLNVFIPNYNGQHKIASILSSYDELIENNKQRIKLLEEMAEEIYKEWFVRMRFHGYETAKFVDGLPEGWENGSIGNLYSVKSGFAFKSEEFGNIGSPIIKIKNIDNLEVDTYNCDRYSGEINERIKKFELKRGDLIVAMTGATIGKIALFSTQKEPYYLNQRVGKFFCKIKGLKNQAFIYQFAKTKEFKDSINNFALGAAQPNISGEQIENIKLLIPNKYCLTEFSEITGVMIDEIFVLKEKNLLLQQTRDLLLPRLISGKLSVENLVDENSESNLSMAAEPEADYQVKN